MSTMDAEAAIARLRATLVGKQGLQGLFANMRLTWVAVVIALAGINYGYEQGSYAQVLVMRSFSDSAAFGQIASDASLKGWTVSILPLGGWLGSLLNGYAINRLSRRGAIFAGGFFCLVGGVVTTAAMSPAYIFAGRFFIGFAVGILSAAAPTYLCEVAPPEIRGTVVGLFQMATCLGILISYWIGYGTNHISDTNSVSWRIPFAIQIVPALGLMLGVFFCPETPRHLMNIGEEEKALQVVAYIRQRDTTDQLVQIEYLEIKAEAMFDMEILEQRYPQWVGKGGFSEISIEFCQMATLFSNWPIFKRTAAGCLTMFFQQWTGIDAVINYAPTIFASIGLDGNTTSLLATGVLGVINVLATIPALQYIDSLGRRSLLLIGTGIMMTCMILLAALSASFGHDWDTHVAASWVAVTCIWVYVAGFAVSWGPCSWSLISEIFPLSVRGPGTSLSASTNWMNNFAIALFVPTALEMIEWKTYLIFIATLALGGLWVIFILPETRNKSLEEMDLAFGSRTAGEDSARMAAIQQRIGLTARLMGTIPSENLGKGEVEHRDGKV